MSESEDHLSCFYLEGLRDVFTFDLHALSHQLQTALVVVHLEEEEGGEDILKCQCCFLIWQFHENFNISNGCYLRVELDAQLLQLLVVFLLQLLQSQFSLDTDSRTRDAVQRTQSWNRERRLDHQTGLTGPRGSGGWISVQSEVEGLSQKWGRPNDIIKSLYSVSAGVWCHIYCHYIFIHSFTVDTQAAVKLHTISEGI